MNGDALRRLDAFARAQPTAVLRNFIEAYAGMSRPYCLPRFLPLDKSNPAHRLADQLGPGFPFTSAAWPWPLENDEPMQPIAQVSLESAGQLLGGKYGRWPAAMLGQRFVRASQPLGPAAADHPQSGSAPNDGQQLSPRG